MKLILGLTTLAVLTACGSSQQTSSKKSTYRPTNCVDRGIAYFKDIGSYPYLSDGRRAAKVARERCRRSPVAFSTR